MTVATRICLLLLCLAPAACDEILRREDGMRAIEGRSLHTATWTGKEMIVGGGNGGSGGGGRECENAACDGWELYDPVADRWRRTYHTLSGGRNGHTAVWTGSMLIVWGGATWQQGANAVVDSGLRYSPDTDLWNSTSGKGAPAPRSEHTAVWTGNEMIVWGGRMSPPEAKALGDGGRYDPRTDSWRPLSSTGAPSARGQHGAVWTGKEMIIWGGQGDGGPASAGARYDPATDSWTPIATAGQPDPRYLPGLIWSGKELVVFGGEPSGAPSFTVAAASYDPQADSWRSLAAPRAGAQGAQWYPAAAWIGDGLVSWRRGAGGERYRAASDSWEVLAPVGEGVIAPRADLEGMSAIWTGSEVVIWGGAPVGGGDAARPRTGLRFNPTTNTWRPTSFVIPEWD
jgi:hypothetical protein